MQRSDGDMEKQVSYLPTNKAYDRSRKEYAGHQHACETPPPRKPVPQKEKAPDKRPKERGGRYDIDSGEVTRSKGKSVKLSLNHLLNFSYDESYQSSASTVWRKRTGPQWYKQSRQRFSKEQYLQANCQFVVREGADYGVLAADADCTVDWSLIEQLRIYDNEIPSCPICLYPPTVARITRCGHVYCWTCMLHYLSLADKSCRCPICFEEVVEADLKSVRSIVSHKYKVGEQITMTLMRRERGSTYVQPKSVWTTSDSKDCRTSLHYVDDYQKVESQFLKFVLARPSDVLQVVRSERLALQEQLMECGGEETLEGVYVATALRLLEDKESHIRSNNAFVPHNFFDPETTCSSMWSSGAAIGLCKSEDDLPVSEATPAKAVITCAEAISLDGETYAEDVTSSGCDTIDDASDLPAVAAGQSNMDLPGRPKANIKTDVYYFYQSADGQHIYLHSLNARCLAREYGSLETAPHVLIANIIEMEYLTMTEEVRKRQRYLSHVPLSCQFTVVELALVPPLVSPNTLRIFDEEIKRRHRARHKKERFENELAKRAELEQERIMGRFPELSVPLSSESHFPDVVPSSPDREFSNVAEVSSSGGAAEVPGNCRTFAQTLLANKGQQHVSLSRSKAVPAGMSGRKGASVCAAVDDVGSDETAVPHQTTFGDALEAAFNNLALASEDQAHPGGKGTGKKKKKQKLLFSTTIARAKS